MELLSTPVREALKEIVHDVHDKDSHEKFEQWLKENQNSLVAEFETVIGQILSNGTEKADTSSQYLSDYDWKNIYYRELHTEYFPTISLMIYCAIHYENISCQKMIFGEDTPLHLLSTEANFIKSYCKAADLVQKNILTKLRNSASTYVINNPVILIQHRCKEIAIMQGYESSELGRFLLLNTQERFLYSTIGCFIEQPIQIMRIIRGKAFLRRYFINYPNFLSLMIDLSLTNKINADFLLLQDYSDKNVYIDQRPITPTEQYILSLFLRSAPEVQNEAIIELIASNFIESF